MKITERLAKLIDVRSILTIALTITLIWGFAVGKIDPKDFLVYVTLVLTFYFAKKDKEETPNDKEVG